MPKFIKSANYVSEYYNDNRQQICLIGRSNAGKSSLINALAKQTIAKTSSTPGKTQLVNFFDFDNVIVVDLPGYGYSKTSRTTNSNIQTLIFEYLNYAKKLSCILHLCSIDVITTQDLEISKELQKICKKHSFSYYVVLTKADKVNKSQVLAQIQKVATAFSINSNHICAISSKKNINLNSIHSIINNNF